MSGHIQPGVIWHNARVLEQANDVIINLVCELRAGASVPTESIIISMLITQEIGFSEPTLNEVRDRLAKRIVAMRHPDEVAGALEQLVGIVQGAAEDFDKVVSEAVRRLHDLEVHLLVPVG